MDVYRTALEMLIHKRDNDRRVRLSPAEIDFAERQILLRSFAAWLHENGAADATREDYEQRVTRAMGQLHRVKSAPEEVASFMLERSGVLREPIAGRVDFVHRTFLEYLAASAFVDDNSIEKLVRLAHDDHWREVVILAAGHANSEQREQLIRGLLRRGSDTPRRRHRLFLLAVACMETSPQLPPALRKDLRDALREVLPPKNMTEAMAVASAGELAVPLLEEYSTRGASVAAASVRALSLIGGESALNALQAYRADRRVTVARQLIRAWSSFDTEEYARRVLAHSPLDRGHITLTDTDQVAQLANLPSATSVFVSLPRRFSSVRDLPSLPNSIFGADLSGIQLEDVRSPADLPFSETMRSISVRNSSLESLAGIQRFKDLGFLSVSGSQRLIDIDDLKQCNNLRYLDLSGTSVHEIVLSPVAALDTLRLDSARVLERICEPVGATNLVIGYAPALRDVDGLRQSHGLRTLYLQLAEIRALELPR
ncbi:NACHT domain-containing protein [Microbacterium lacticum]